MILQPIDFVVWTWIIIAHISHHTLNNNVGEQGAGGHTLLVEVGK